MKLEPPPSALADRTDTPESNAPEGEQGRGPAIEEDAPQPETLGEKGTNRNSAVPPPTTAEATRARIEQAQPPPRRYLDRTHRFRPDQIERFLALFEEANHAIGYPKLTKDELLRIALEHLLRSDNSVELIKSLRPESS